MADEDETIENDAEEQTGGENSVRYVGDPNDDFSGPSEITVFGTDFTKGEFTEIEDKNVLRKLRGHSHFEFQGEKVEKVRSDRDDLAAAAGGTGGLERLKEIAKAESVDFNEDGITKAQLMKLIRAKRKAS